MANSLGTLGEFQIDPNQDPRETGVRNMAPEALGMRTTGPESAPRDPFGTIVGADTEGKAAKALEEIIAAKSPAASLSIEELLNDCERALSNFERHHERRDCTQLEAQLRNELFAQLFGHHVQAELARAMEVLRAHYDKRWSHRSYLRNDAHRFSSVTEARKLTGRLTAARGADFLPVARELLEICRISLSEPSLLRTEEV